MKGDGPRKMTEDLNRSPLLRALSLFVDCYVGVSVTAPGKPR